MLAPILEADARPGDEILDRPGHEYLARIGGRGDTSAHDDSQTARLAVDELALAGVDTRTRVDAETGYLGLNRLCAADCTRRPVEGREEAVPRGVDLGPAIAGQRRRTSS